MRLKIISCEVLAREVYYCAATSPHTIDIQLLRRGLHNTPDVLRAEVQRLVDEASSNPYEAIALGYGLCGNSVAGVTARNVQLVVPRAHDCITLYLGSRSRYQEEFTKHPGTYYYVADYIERRDSQDSSVGLGATSDTRRREVYNEYVQKYGKDNADYLMDVMGSWAAHYTRAAYIDMGLGGSAAIEALAQQEARNRGWSFERLEGNLALIRKLTHGEWNNDFVIVPPGHRITVSYDQSVIGCTLHVS